MAMPYTKEQLAQANNVNLIDYAVMHGYQLEKGGIKSLHIKHSGGLYLFKDSNKFYHHSTATSGGPIDFIMQFEHMDFLQAVEHLLGVQPGIRSYTPLSVTAPAPAPVKSDKGVLILPEKADNYKRVYWYLCAVRAIDTKIVSALMRERKIYQQAERGNCVFVGYDEQGTPRYCSKRGTSPDKPFKGDADNSDKSYPFAMPGTSSRLFVLESPIDVMSYASLLKRHDIDYTREHLISLGCLSDKALEWYLSQHPGIKQIVFALDNDINGKSPDGSPCNHGQEAAARFCAKYEQLGYDTAVHTPVAKDFNEDLVNARNARAMEHMVHKSAERDGENMDGLEA
jgi:hypothetical protein